MPKTFLIALAISALTTLAAPPPDYGHDFVTIGDPGNRPTDPAAKQPNFPRPLGAVNYRYRLSRTEVTYDQQVEFLNAYAPYAKVSETRPWGQASLVGFDSNGPVWRLNEGTEGRPAELSARLWMRYCNWLHNDKALTEDAFESGAYDASTFGVDEDGNLTDQMTRSPGARYWVPSIDEWVKGGYWDPSRYGEGEGGYWLYPYQSDEPPVSGLPESGGQTNAGPGDNPLDAGSYPDAQTPWGLLDYSGGEFELAERLNSRAYVRLGSNYESSSSEFADRLGFAFGASATGGQVGLRLASAVPAPGAAGAFALLGLAARRRR